MGTGGWVGGVDTQGTVGWGIFPKIGRVGTRVRYHCGRIRIGRYPG